ncbi:putative Triphosphate tunnel metalloenzyme 3 [Nannochloris sp. 'desiccata']|nr:putative Triphosphate tunnel metalloenzyme 3 [Chlorella desiccata (nom. nud.)]
MHSWIRLVVTASLTSSAVLPKWHARAQTIPNRTPTRGQRRVRDDQGGASRPATINYTFLATTRTFHQKTYRSTADWSHSTRPRAAVNNNNEENRKMSPTPAGADDKITAAVEDHGLSGTEVEIKLRIPDSASYDALAQALIPCFKQAHEQENWFFDGAGKELSNKRVVLRLRFYDIDRKALLTCKGKQVLEGGVGTAPEEEETIDPKVARGYLADPQALLESSSPLITKLKSQYGLKKGLTLLGGFQNLRKEYSWRGNLLELDQTSYPWGTLHELECETTTPQKLKLELESLLDTYGVAYSDSTKSKFANFVDKTLE